MSTTVSTVFSSAAGPCFGTFHAGAQAARDAVVVMCPPLGYESICSHGMYRQLATTLAVAGFDVLRFDYHGTGDSAGSDADADRVAAWLASVDAAIAEAKRLGGVQQVVLFGLRFGATLALRAAAGRGDVDSIVLWAPCASGRAYVRELRAAELARGLASAGDALEAQGMQFTRETLDEMGRLDPLAGAAVPARAALVIGRDDMPGEGPLPSRLRALGCETEFRDWSGYAAMMVAEAHEAAVPGETLSSIAQWLALRHAPQSRARSRVEPRDAQLVSGHVVENAVAFGERGELFGVLAEPQAGLRSPRGDTAVLMLNVGGNHHIGPNRNYVKAAREFAAAGYRAFRFDVRGIGDSEACGKVPRDSVYGEWATADVAAAIDALAARGCERFVLMGICSGSYLAAHTALKDSRVSAVMLVNSRLHEWNSQAEGGLKQSYYKSARYYRNALLRSDVYARLLRGQVDVPGIARRMGQLFAARAVRAWNEIVLRRASNEGVLPKFRQLARRGVETVLVMSEDDDGIDFVNLHLGVNGKRMRGHRNFRMSLLADSDHTFSTAASQRALFAELRAFLDRLHEPAPARQTISGRVATT